MMPNTTYRKLAATLLLLDLAFAGTAWAKSPQVTVKNTVWKTCVKADAAVIFGASVDVCVVTDIKTSKTKVVATVCGGMKVATGVHVAVGGASLGVESMVCTDVEVEYNDHTPTVDEVIKDEKVRDAIKKAFLGAVKKLEDSKLKTIGGDPGKKSQLDFTGDVKLIDKSGNGEVHAAYERGTQQQVVG